MPFVVGIDGVGRLDDGRRVYFALPKAPFGSVSARLAVQIVKYMGAKRVVATGRNAESLKALTTLGADVTIPFADSGDALEDALEDQVGHDGIDVVLDYLCDQAPKRKPIAGAKAGKDTLPIQLVQVGSLSLVG